jgi:hypothetical protein
MNTIPHLLQLAWMWRVPTNLRYFRRRNGREGGQGHLLASSWQRRSGPWS